MDALERLMDEFGSTDSINEMACEGDEVQQREADELQQGDSIYQVVLRLKPLDTTQVNDTIASDFLSVRGNSLTTSFVDKKKNTVETRYDFARVFKPSTTQAEFFLKVITPSLRDFFEQQDVLIFSYGVSNSGKSFTVQGTPTNPGIIPRLLHSIFGTVEEHLVDEHWLALSSSKIPVSLNEIELRKLLGEKRQILRSVVDDVLQETLDCTLSGVPPKEINDVLSDVPKIPFNNPKSVKCSIWISFFEIYNEQIYDLLVNNEERRHCPLKLAFDKNEDSYSPRQLKHYPANSWEEAFDLYRVGKRNLHVSATLLNRKSSRSHSVFSVKLLAQPPDSKTDYYFVRHFHVCDLAGSERMVHLNEEKSSVTEMKFINTSLLALNKCFLNLKNLTNDREVRCAPQFRESKLTMVFKKFLMGKARTIMITNVSQDPNLQYQTQLVLEMTAMAREVRLQQRAAQTLACSQTPNYIEELEALMEENANYKRELSSLEGIINRLTLEKEELVDQCAKLKEQVKDTESTLSQIKLQFGAANENCERYHTYASQLETQFRKTREEKKRNEETLRSRISTIKSEHKLLFDKLKRDFDVQECEPTIIVDRVLRIYHDAKQQLQDQQYQIDSLKQINEGFRKRSTVCTAPAKSEPQPKARVKLLDVFDDHLELNDDDTSVIQFEGSPGSSIARALLPRK